MMRISRRWLSPLFYFTFFFISLSLLLYLPISLSNQNNGETWTGRLSFFFFLTAQDEGAGDEVEGRMWERRIIEG